MTANPIVNFQAPPRPRRLQLLKELLLDQQPGERVVMTNVSWEEYDQLSQFRDDNRKSVRLAFAAGDLEVMTISYTHERLKGILTTLVMIACLVQKRAYTTAGNLTIRKEDLERGIEPDTSFYIQHAGQMIAPRVLDFEHDPPPDLAIEIELSNSIVAKMPIYAVIRIPEIWRTDGEHLAVSSRNENGDYIAVTQSEALNGITVDELNRFFERGLATDEGTLAIEWMTYLQSRTV